MSCGIGCRRSSDPALLWLWHRPAATALIRPPSRGTSIWRGCGPRKDKKKKEEEEEEIIRDVTKYLNINMYAASAALKSQKKFFLNKHKHVHVDVLL